MSSDARRKEKQRLKRKQKQLAIRKARSASPFRQIAQGGELVACAVNSDWRKRGQATAFVLRTKPGGGYALAGFMVDLWCAGLKDAWTDLDATREQYDEAVRIMSKDMAGTVGSAVLEEVRQIVAGAIRFAVQNGFRLPPHYQRSVQLLGDIGDWRNADLSHFGVEGGKLRWVGPMFDLRRRLIGSTAEQFLAREDVEFIAEPEGDELVQHECADEDDDFDGVDILDKPEDRVALMETMDSVVQNGADATRRWCFEQFIAPAEHLDDAMRIMLAAIIGIQTNETPQTPDPQAMDDFQRMLSDQIETFPPEERIDLERGLDQIQQFMKTFPSPQDMLKQLGLGAIKED